MNVVMKNLRKNYKIVLIVIVVAIGCLLLLGYGLSYNKNIEKITADGERG